MGAEIEARSVCVSTRVCVGGVCVCVAAGWMSVPLRQSVPATERIANIACLAFSEGNKPIDFLAPLSVLFTQKGSGALVKEKLTRRWEGWGRMCVGGWEGSGGRMEGGRAV